MKAEESQFFENEMPCCLNCAFWDADRLQDDVTLGETFAPCRRYPPTRLPDEKNTPKEWEEWEQSDFPKVLDSRWCGEWKSMFQTTLLKLAA